MFKRPTVTPGTWTVVCQRTGFRVLSSMIQREWNNLLVWDKVWEPRQPQDYLKGIPDDQSVPFANPMTEPRFLTANQVKASDL